MQSELTSKMKYAAKWSSIGEVCAKLIAPVTNAILARLLIPEAFGVVATLTVVISFAEIFTDAGFQKYLVQHEFAGEEDLELSTNVAFWTNLLLSLVLWAGIAIFATPIANAVGSPGCETAIIVMSGEIPLLALSSIQMARYRREFDFKGLFYAKIATALIPLFVTVPLALIFRNYWALVLGTLGKDLVNAVLLTLRSHWKPKWVFRWQKLKQMLSFSLWTILENITIWLSLNVDVLIVSSLLSSYDLGLYKTSISTVNSIMNLITGSAMPVAFASLSRCQGEKGAFREVYYRFQRILGVIVLPMGFGIWVYQDLVTQILLGSQWDTAADFIGSWALACSFSIVFHNLNSEAFRSLGRPKLSVLTQILHIVVLIPVVMWSVNQGYETLIHARSLVRLEMIAVSSAVAYFALGLNLFTSLKNLLPQLLSAAVMALAGKWLCSIHPHILWQLTGIALCVLIYGGCMLLIPAGRSQLLTLGMQRKSNADARKEPHVNAQH